LRFFAYFVSTPLLPAQGRLAGGILLRRNTRKPFQILQLGDKLPRENLFKPAAKC